MIPVEDAHAASNAFFQEVQDVNRASTGTNPDRRHRRRPGGPVRRLPPRPPRAAVRDPRCPRAHRRQLARALGLAAPVHAGPLRRACRHALPGLADDVPHEGRDGRLPRAYAERFALPVRSGVRVDGCRGEAARSSSPPAIGEFEADQVVVAMANYQVPRVPAFGKDLDPAIVQLHSMRLQATRRSSATAASSSSAPATRAPRSRSKPHATASHVDVRTRHGARAVPHRRPGRPHLSSSGWCCACVFHRILTVDTPIGRKVRPKVICATAGRSSGSSRTISRPPVCERVPRVAGVKDGQPLLDDGRALDAANVIWCTGFHPGFSWIDLPVFGDDGEPLHERGIVADRAGPLLRRPAFPLRVLVDDDPRRRDVTRIASPRRSRRASVNRRRRPRPASRCGRSRRRPRPGPRAPISLTDGKDQFFLCVRSGDL